MITRIPTESLKSNQNLWDLYIISRISLAYLESLSNFRKPGAWNLCNLRNVFGIFEISTVEVSVKSHSNFCNIVMIFRLSVISVAIWQQFTCIVHVQSNGIRCELNLEISVLSKRSDKTQLHQLKSTTRHHDFTTSPGHNGRNKGIWFANCEAPPFFENNDLGMNQNSIPKGV